MNAAIEEKHGIAETTRAETFDVAAGLPDRSPPRTKRAKRQPDGRPTPNIAGMARKKGPHPKHVPQRMCVTCRERDNKRTLTRLVRTGEGVVEIDPTGRRNGRGAYLCDNPGCWDKALGGGLLTRALNTSLTAEVIIALRQHAASLRDAQTPTSLSPARAETVEPARS